MMIKYYVTLLIFGLCISGYSKSFELLGNSFDFGNTEYVKGYFSKTGKFQELLNKNNDIDLSPFTAKIKHIASECGFNDYLILELLTAYVESSHTEAKSKNKTVFIYAILSELSYEVRVVYSNGKYALLFNTVQKLYDVDYVKYGKKKYYSLYPGLKSISGGYTDVKLDRIKSLKEFSLAFCDPIEKHFDLADTMNLRFTIKGVFHEVDMCYSDNLIQLLKRYPRVEYCVYGNFVSSILKNSFIKKVIPLIVDSTYEATLTNCLEFCRTVSKYEIDKYDKHFFPEEFLFYQKADCEDFSSMFVACMNIIGDYKYVYLEYSNHLNVGIELRDIKEFENVIKFKGREYVICEPTDPNNSAKLGEYAGYELRNILECTDCLSSTKVH